MFDREVLVSAYQSGRLLEFIRSALSEGSEKTKLASDLAVLHNEGSIDLLVTFGALTREGRGGPDFFLLLQVFKEALPEIEAPVREVIRTVLHLYHEAGDDLAACTIFSALRGFYAKSLDRPRAALAEIKANAQAPADLLVTTLIAGSAGDSSSFVDETIRLCGEADAEVRKQAFYALGRLEGDPNHAAKEKVVRTLEDAVAADEDDEVLASALSSAFELSSHPAADQPRLIAVIAGALARGGDTTLKAAARIFGFRTRELSPGLLQLLLDHFVNVKPAERGTLDSIDYGISHLLESDSVEAGLGFLERLLRSESQNLDLHILDDAARTIRDAPALRNKVTTRWLLSGDPKLCEDLDEIVRSHMGDPPELAADPTELAGADPVRFLFAARKAIGYLFLEPVSVASFIVSLMRQVPEASVRPKLGDLLLNPPPAQFQ